MGLEVGTSRVKKLADELGLARVWFVNMLDRERADFYRTLGQIQEQFGSKCVAVHIPIGAEHELQGIVDVLHMCAYLSPDGGKEGEPVRDPRRHGGARPVLPREAPRRGRPDRRGADGALPRGRGARQPRRRRGAEARHHPRRGVPGGLRRRDEEPRHARAARPGRRGRPVAGEAGRADGHGRGHDRGVRVQDDRRPVRGQDQPLPRRQGRDHDRHDAPRSPRARQGADGLPAPAAGQGEQAREGVRRGRHRGRREAEGRPHRRPAARPRAARRGRAASRSPIRS